MRQPISKLTAFLFACCCMCVNTSYGQVRAGFTANATAGCAPLSVQFTDQSSGGATAWKWDLGNGTISSFQNPSTSYYSPGTYTVKLVVSNAQGADSVIKQAFITVFSAPDPAFVAGDTSGCFPLGVQFTNLTPITGGTQVQWKWDFGDGNTSTAQNPQHTYANAGNFTVILQATTANGCVQTVGKSQYIRIQPGIQGGFTDAPAKNCQVPVKVEFTNSSRGPGILSYYWDFGDGTSSALPNPVHQYNTKGIYTVRLTTSSNLGCQDSVVKPGLLNIGGEIAQFAAPVSICTGQLFTLSNTSSPAPLSSGWSFGNGGSSTAAAPSVSYPAPGTYMISLVDTFASCIDSVSRPVEVLPNPSASFSANDTFACSSPFKVAFKAGMASANSYYWDFGDGTTATGMSPVHTYLTPGAFTVTLIVAGVNGCSQTLTKAGYIQIKPIGISLSMLPSQGCAPLTVAASAQITGTSDKILHYQWDFGDGTGSNLAAPAKTYPAVGDYTVKLTVMTTGGCLDSAVVPHAVLASQKPVVKFSADPRDGCRSKHVFFTDQSIPAGDQWLWNFGDGQSSGAADPQHQYNDTGYFNVGLVVWNKGCADTLVVNRFIHVDAPVAAFIVGANCSDKYTRSFTSISIGAHELLWDFGDGTQLSGNGLTGSGLKPVHHYGHKGVYPVKLFTTNGACVDSVIQSITIADEHLSFKAAGTETCKADPVIFTLSGYDPVYTTNVVWDFGDGTGLQQGQGSGPVQTSFAHTYTQAGRYTVKLIFTDVNGCKDSSVQQQYITINGPTANFQVQGSVCVKAPVTFTDQSKSDGTNAIVQWRWNYGDGIVMNYSTPPFVHTYSTGGWYAVSLTTIDSKGCMDSLVKNKVILVSDPHALFGASDTSICPGNTVLFSDHSTGPGLQYRWDFGNGTNSLLPSPSCTYLRTGIYSVSLHIIDSLGCRDSANHAIRVSTPVAAFDLSDSTGNCPPLEVVFTNRSQNAGSVQWDFGDGSLSTLANPVHFYNFPGTYYVKALVMGPGGCLDSMTRKIMIRGPKGSFRYSPFQGCKPLNVLFNASIQKNESLIWDLNDGDTKATQDTVLNYVYNSAGNFLPKMILIDSSGCKVAYIGKDTIRITGVNIGATISKTLICDSGMIRFSDESAANDYITRQLWDFGDGSTSAQEDGTHYYDKVGLYTIGHWVYTKEGCVDSLSWHDTIKVFRSPVAAIDGDSAGCVPVTLHFQAVVIPGSSGLMIWQWDFGTGGGGSGPGGGGSSQGGGGPGAGGAGTSGVSDTTSANSTAKVIDSTRAIYSSPGIYVVRLRVTNSNACYSEASRNINIWPLPDLYAVPDTLECRGRPLQLTASGADHFLWGPAPYASCLECAAPLIDPPTDTLYVVTGASLQGCSKKDSVHVRVRQPFTMSVSASTGICEGAGTVLTASGADQYLWSPGLGLSDTLSASTQANPGQTTAYSVIGRDADHCFSDTGRVVVTVNPDPHVFIGNDTTVITGSTIHLHATHSDDVDQWNWLPVTGLSCINCSDPDATVKNTITYHVTVFSAAGCSDTASITINTVCNGNNWFVPNTFTPNGDGMNDVFYIRGKGLDNVQSIVIFNRWGQVVFERRNFPPNDPSVGWDGNYNGKKAQSGVYIYVVEIVCDNSSVITYHGNVSLVR